MRLSLFARVLIPVVLVAGAACGSDDGESSSAASFCDDGRAVASASSDEELGEAFEAAIKSAPSDVRGDLTPLRDALAEAAESDDDSGFLTDEFRAANNNAIQAIANECEFDGLLINAREYAFDGLGPSVPAGPVAVHLKNTGSEVHDFLLFERGTATEDDLVAIVNDNPSVDDGRLEEVAVALPVQAGQESYLLTNLAAGDYVAVCFINQGMTSFDQFSADVPQGTKDHRELGMTTQFSVA